MAKVSSEMWIVIFVATVAVVGVGLMMAGGMSFSGANISGQATKIKLSPSTIASLPTVTCTETDAGKDFFTTGTITLSTGKMYTDFCNEVGSIREYYCDSSKKGYSYTEATCGLGRLCQEGDCVDVPDISVEDVAIVVNPELMIATVEITVKNNGRTAAAIGTYTADLDWYYEAGSSTGSGQTLSDTASLSAGSTKTISVVFGMNERWINEFVTPYDKEIFTQIYLDSASATTESDETNNIFGAILSTTSGEITSTMS